MREVPFFDALERGMQYGSQRGYNQLIQAYITFIRAKLAFHTMHPEFTANMDYEEYRALKKVDDPNEGFLTIMELMDLQDRVDALQKVVFSNLKPGVPNECRIAALVPLVEESFGIYQFLTSMLRAMHYAIQFDMASEALAPLRQRYRAQYETLRKFYLECEGLRYLTSLITIPKLAALPEDFTDKSNQMVKYEPPREKTPPPDDLWGSVSNITPEPFAPPTDGVGGTHQLLMSQQQQQIEYEQHQHFMLIQQQAQQQQQNQYQQNDELTMLRMQNTQAQQLLAGYESRMIEMTGKLQDYERRLNDAEQRAVTRSNFDLAAEQRDRERDTLIQQLRDEIAMWKTKYENIAKMYAQLRKEHLDLLNKMKDMQRGVATAKESQDALDSMRSTVKAKLAELDELAKQRDHWKNEYERTQQTSLDQMALLRREAADSKAKFEQLSQSKGTETKELVQKLESERADLEKHYQSQLADYESTKSLLRDLKSELERLRQAMAAKDEEVLVLQAGLDQSLVALKQMQERGSSTEADLLGKLDHLHIEHRSHMDKIMDSVLEDCKAKASDALFELESAAHPGNQTVTPELLLSMLEKLSANSNEFAASFTKHLVGGDSQGEHQAEAIRNATNLAQSVSSFLAGTKGVTRFAAQDDVVDRLIQTAKESGLIGRQFFHRLQSGQLAPIAFPERPSKVQQCNAELQSALQPVIKLTETLIPKDVSEVKIEDELADAVENEMMSAAKAIEEAAAMLSRMLQEPSDPKLNQTDLQVHKSILASAKAITDAIARLIICATHSQKEIVANGKGSGTAAAFYKKNSRWVDGLVSAAKAVATATKTLVESANGVVQGTHKMEQLIVAANEVAAATAQLVAASRVKAIRGSKTQDKLEVAAKAVTDATKLLVKTVEQVRNSKQESNGDVDYSKLSAHEFKKREMEQQVRILTLEKTLTDARRQLADMRRVAYHKEGDYNQHA